MSEYRNLVNALKALSQDGTTLPMAEDEWYTRPDTVSYGTVRMDFESGQIHGNGRKTDTACEGSVDLFSLARSGAGWVKKITEALENHCGGSWNLNSHTYERETGLFHWEWTFEALQENPPDDGEADG